MSGVGGELLCDEAEDQRPSQEAAFGVACNEPLCQGRIGTVPKDSISDDHRGSPSVSEASLQECVVELGPARTSVSSPGSGIRPR